MGTIIAGSTVGLKRSHLLPLAHTVVFEDRPFLDRMGPVDGRSGTLAEQHEPMRTRYATFRHRSVLTIVSAVAFRGLLSAQSLTAAELLAPEGITFRNVEITTAVPWDTLLGIGVTWEYDWITVDTTDDIFYTTIPLNEAPDAASYPEADRVVRSVGGIDNDYVIDRFFNVSSNEMHELGSVGPVLSYVFDDPELVYGLPMPLNQVFADDYCFWSDGFGIQYHFCGEHRVAFDAMGTLVLPYGTFTDVKHVTQWSSSFETTEPSTDSSYTIRQQWFLPGVTFPLLDVNLFIDQEGEWWPTGRLLDQASITGLAEWTKGPVFSLWPNPAADAIQLSGLPSGNVVVEILHADGRVVKRTSLTSVGSSSIALNELPNGLYLARLISAQGISDQRFVKGR
jgi:hypothetical protein